MKVQLIKLYDGQQSFHSQELQQLPSASSFSKL